MANSDKNIVITPNTSQSADPQIVFSGADASTGPQNITIRAYPTNSGTLSFEGSAGQLFSVNNSTTGTIFSANDVSGIPSIEVIDTGLVKLAQYGGNVLVGTGTDNATDRLQVNGNIIGTIIKGSTFVSSVGTGTAPFTVSSSTMVNNLNAQYWNGNAFSSYLNQGVRTSDNPTFGTVTASLSGNATSATTATNWGSYGAVPGAGTSFGNANTIGRSDANGYTYFNYINSNTASNENPTIGGQTQIIMTNGSDNFYRKGSISHLTAGIQGYASGSWGISITGNAATASSAPVLTGGDSAFYALLYNSLSGDLNTYNNPGLYSAEYTGSTNKPSGPGNGHFIQISDAIGTDVKTQWYFPSDGGTPYMRLMWKGGDWKSWRAISTTARAFAQNLILG